jgi:predicted nucleotidyltransferase
MTEEIILQQLSRMPESLKKEVLDFANFLLNKQEATSSTEIANIESPAGLHINAPLPKEELIERICQKLSKYPIEKAWLFGSFVRGEARPDSDVDLLIEFVQPNQVDLFDYAGIQQDIEAITGRRVDLVEAGYVVSHIADQINQDKELIYERETR